jgi:putrescine aminotransferase
VQGEGGVNVPPPGYLRGVRELCDRSGAVFIADEVQTGLGRCGALFACDIEGVVPDVLTLAKGLSGGVMPIGAYVARPAVWNAAYAKAPLLHTSTFGGNPLACAAALAALDVLVEDDLAANARERGAELLAGARAIAARYPDAIADVRGVGLLAGVELRNEGYGGTIIPELLKRGVTVAWTLNQQRVIRLEPPLIVDANQIATALRAFDEAVAVALDRLGVLACPT